MLSQTIYLHKVKYFWLSMRQTEILRRPDVTKRLLQLKTQGKSFSEIYSILNKEFGLGIKNRFVISNFYYSELKDLRAGGKMKIVDGELTKLEILRQEKIDLLMNQMEKINKILWSYYRELEHSKRVLKRAVQKWTTIIDAQDKPDANLLREIRSTITSNIANVSVITGNIMKQLDLQSRTLGMLSKPTTVNISNLEIVTQINQVLKKIEAQGYYMVKPSDEKVFKKLMEEGKLTRY